MVFGNGVKNKQAAAYNAARTVLGLMPNLIKKLWTGSTLLGLKQKIVMHSATNTGCQLEYFQKNVLSYEHVLQKLLSHRVCVMHQTKYHNKNVSI